MARMFFFHKEFGVVWKGRLPLIDVPHPAA